MGSKRGSTKELVERCKAVGWEVTISGSGHWRVKTHEGKVFSIASTSSDVHGQKNAERAAVRHGLRGLEEKIALENARKRLERIEEDRANGVDWEAEERKIKEQKKIIEPVLGYVNGVAILERVPARAAHPRSPEGKTVEIKHGMELLLEDDTVIFECVHPVMLNHVYQDCGRQFEAANSLRSHIAWHSRQVSGEKETAAILADEDPMKAIVEAEAEAEDETTAVTDTVNDVEAVSNERIETIEDRINDMKDGESMTVKAKITVTPGIFVRLSELASEIDDLVDDAAELTESIRIKRNEFRKLLAELPQYLADGDLRAKARKYDAMMEAASQ